MFVPLFQWTSRNGARVLFALALIIFLVQLITAVVIYVDSDATENMYGHSQSGRMAWSVIAALLVSGLQSASLPLVGALVLDRLKPRE